MSAAANDRSIQTALQHHRNGRLAAAEEVYRQVLADNPNHCDALHLLGLIAEQRGQFEAAAELLTKAIASHPAPRLWINLGKVLYRLKKFEESITAYQSALAMAPADADTLFSLGNSLRAVGRCDEAIECFRAAVERRPNFFEALANLGITYQDKRDWPAAIAALQQALVLRQNEALLHQRLSVCLSQSGRLDEAIATQQRAISLAPDHPAFHASLGHLLHAARRWEAAVAAYREALRLRAPANGSVHLPLGICLFNLKKFHEALACHRQAVALSPEWAEAQLWLGHDFYKLRDYRAAAAAFKRAVDLAPDAAQHHYFLGNTLKACREYDAAMASFQRAAEIDPQYADAQNNVALALEESGRLDEAIRTFEHILQLDPTAAAYDSNRLYALHFHPNYDAQALLEEHRRWAHRHAEPLKQSITPHDNDRSETRRLRIGYVSPDFRDHVLARCLKPILAQHDREQVEIFCYSNVENPDAQTDEFRKLSDQWREIRSLSDEQAVQLIRADRIDILLDLSLHSAHNRMLLFARKPAPVQVSYLGYCSTTGVDAIDYRFSDPHLDPAETDYSCYTEQTMRLPTTYWNFTPAGEPPQPAELPAAGSGFVTFGCLNNFAKVSKPALDLWRQLLTRMKDAKLLLYCPVRSAQERVTDHFARHGVAGGRLEFFGWQSWADFMATYQRIDIALDTFPYGGGVTTCDALWNGVPVVTLSGRTAVGRGGRSILSNVGLPDLITFDADAYVDKCIEIAGDLDRLREMRSSLRDRMAASPLMDGRRLARDIETAYRQMWQAWCRGGG